MEYQDRTFEFVLYCQREPWIYTEIKVWIYPTASQLIIYEHTATESRILSSKTAKTGVTLFMICSANVFIKNNMQNR